MRAGCPRTWAATARPASCAASGQPRLRIALQHGEVHTTERDSDLQRPSLWRTTLILPSGGGDRFDLSKKGQGEPALWVRLHRLEA